MSHSGFCLINPTPEQHRAIFAELTKGAVTLPPRKLPDVAKIKADLKRITAEMSERHRITRRPHCDPMDGQWQFWIEGVLFDHFSNEDECRSEWDAIMFPETIAAE